MQLWETEKPHFPGKYLVYRPYFYGRNGGEITICYWNGDDWIDDYRDCPGRELKDEDVTHWISLPHSPDEIPQLA